jgi:hypothetical protein
MKVVFPSYLVEPVDRAELIIKYKRVKEYLMNMTLNVQLFVYLLLLYQVKHFVGDYVLQNVWMLQKGSPDWEFFLPLTIHCGIHALMTLAVVLYLSPALWWLAVLDFFVHFAMDRIKAGPRYLGRYNDPRTKSFWVCFGLDQMVHHLTHIYICLVIAAAVVAA